MKFYIDIEKKKYRHYYNLAQGLNIKKNKKQINTYSEICTKNYFIIFIFLVLGCFLEVFIQFDTISFIVIILSILAFLINTIFLIIFIVTYFKNGNRLVHDEVRIDKDGIYDYQENGMEINKSWKEIDEIVCLEDVIFVFSKKIIFILPMLSNLKETLLKEISNQNIKIIDVKESSNGIKRITKTLVPIFLVLMFTFISYCFFEDYNVSAIYNKMNKIINSQNVTDTKIYSYGKYGIVEQELTDFYQEFYKNKNNYDENSAVGTFKTFTPSFLKENKDKLSNILKNELPNKRIKAEAFLKNMISLLQEEKTNSRILKWNLDSYYTDIYYEYSFKSSFYIQLLQQELSVNDKKMDYLERIVLLLNREDACYEITDDKLIFCNSIDADEYNRLYDLILNENSEINSNGITA